METIPNDGVVWDGWPDGLFECLYSFVEFRLANELAVHWACTPKGGDKRGDDKAEEWQRGKQTGRRCNGVLRCGNQFCTIVVRPQTRTAKIAQQLERRCKCGDKLRHEDCTVILWLNTFKYERFDQIIFANPKAGLLALLVGSGPGTSVAEISPVLMNADCIKAEKCRVTGGRGTTREFVDNFSNFEAKHPGFVVYSQFGMTTVVILQTRFMLSQLVKEHIIEDAVNGIVSDAAHGFWRDKPNLLIISSTYCLALRCWVPGIMTYSNGASEKHYELHFRALFETMAEEAQRQDTEVTDDLFRNVSTCRILIYHLLLSLSIGCGF
ncbi:hypothetical protein BDZ94DRAFT_1379047 [Collybia nuda]|uniref:Uncharacterized protein n=1 Tax=Collybia nuda TaxID=64659 RepID=A0A9P5XY92_9AGAR|nr:hypothetical protein BDZ94DRAFT_1379047 [Collybia nuda]